MQVKRSIWTTILLITIFLTLWYGISSISQWYTAFITVGANKPLCLFELIGTMIVTMLLLFSFIMGIKNDRLFVKTFIIARVSSLLLSIITFTYITYLNSDTSAYLVSVFMSTTYSLICIGYLLTSKNIKNVYTKMVFKISEVKQVQPALVETELKTELEDIL